MFKVLVFFVNVFINMVMDILFFFYVKIKKKVLKVVMNNVFYEWFVFVSVLYILLSLSIFCFFYFVCFYRYGIRNWLD